MDKEQKQALDAALAAYERDIYSPDTAADVASLAETLLKEPLAEENPTAKVLDSLIDLCLDEGATPQHVAAARVLLAAM